MRAYLAAVGLMGIVSAPLSVGAQMDCDPDCVAIMSAGIGWLLDEHRDVPPSAMVLDTVMSGVVFYGEGDGTRWVDRAMLDRLIASAGLDRGSRDLILCDDSLPHGARCVLRRGTMLVTIQPPLRDPGDPGNAHIEILYHGSFSGLWLHRHYLLALAEEGYGWRVTDAQLVGQS